MDGRMDKQMDNWMNGQRDGHTDKERSTVALTHVWTDPDSDNHTSLDPLS